MNLSNVFVMFFCLSVVLAENLPIACTRDNMSQTSQNCSKDPNFVCGYSNLSESQLAIQVSSFLNTCFACANQSISFFIEGYCEENIQNSLFCDPTFIHSKTCRNDEFAPVCGYVNQSTCLAQGQCSATYANSCFACQDKDILYVVLGSCPS